MRLLVDLLPWKCSFHIARYCSLCKSLCEDVLWGPARFAGGGSWFQCICSLDKLSFLFSSIEAVKPDKLSDGLSKYASLLGFLLLEPFTKFYLSMSSLDGWCSGWCTGVVSLSSRSVYWGLGFVARTWCRFRRRKLHVFPRVLAFLILFKFPFFLEWLKLGEVSFVRRYFNSKLLERCCLHFR